MVPPHLLFESQLSCLLSMHSGYFVSVYSKQGKRIVTSLYPSFSQGCDGPSICWHGQLCAVGQALLLSSVTKSSGSDLSLGLAVTMTISFIGLGAVYVLFGLH